MSSPSWVNIKQWEVVNFDDVISQGVAKSLQVKEENCREKISTSEVNDVDNTPPEAPKDVTNGDFANDEMLAKMLQIQFDKEYEQNWKNNGSSKTPTSFDNYYKAPLNYDVESDSEEEEIFTDWDGNNWDTFDLLEKELAFIPPQSVLKRHGKAKTKQDVTTDTYKLSSKVFNSLKPHSYTEEFCKYKVRENKKKCPIYKSLSIDEYTWRLIRNMIKGEIIKKVTGIISFDNDVIMIRAIQSWVLPSRKCYGKPAVRPILCSIRVFRIGSGPYERARLVARQKAEREVANYAKLRAAGLPCLDIILLRKHVLVTSYRGPVLSEERMTPYTYECVYEEVRKTMKKLFVEANLILTNLSEHNIVWYFSRVYFINLSQAVEPSHENALDFLFRDCDNVVSFFTRKGVSNIYSASLFMYITGCSCYTEQSLSKLQKRIKRNERRRNTKTV